MEQKLKSGCVKAGLSLVTIFILRCITDLAVLLLSYLMNGVDSVIVYFVTTSVSLILLYGGGITVTALVFGYKKDDAKGLYLKDKRFGKAVSWFLPAYGTAQAINIAVLLVSFLLVGNSDAVSETYGPMTGGEGATGIAEMVFTVIQLSVFAPLFEEFWFRGIIQTKLTEHGHGFAIMVSALAFGFAHGNIHQFCFAFAVGIVLGYIRYASQSILPTTVIHCILNSISALILVLSTNEIVVSAIDKLTKGAELSDAENAMFTALCVTLLAVCILMVAGVFAAIAKLRKNRLYRPVNNCPELSAKQKTAALVKNPVFITGTVLCTAYIAVCLFI